MQENEENITLIWFNPIANTNDDIEKIKEDLLAINNFIGLIDDIDLCIDYIKSITKEKIFLIISGNNAYKLLPNIVTLSQLDSIFIFPENQEKYHRLLEDFSKIEGIFDNHNELLKAIKDTIKHVNRQMQVVSFYDKHQYGTRDLSEQSSEFLWFQLFMDVIHHLPHDDKAKEEMLTTCRQYYRDNRRILQNIDDFEANYHVDDCIRWYTKETFVYRLINKALRTEDIEQLYIFRYYIADLSNQLAQECKKLKTGICDKLNLYRGMPIHKKEAERFQRNVGKLIAANGYWSSSRKRPLALQFANKLMHHPDIIPLLFEIECDLNDHTESIIFADISQDSNFEEEEEVLFDAGSVFQIEKVSEEESDTKLCIVKLKATGGGQTLSKQYIEENQNQMEEESPRIMFSILLKRMGKIKKSLEFLEYLLKNPGEENIAHIHNGIGGALTIHKKYDRALTHFKIAFQLTFFSNPPDRKYSTFVLHKQGGLYAQQGKNKEAVSCYRRAVSIYETEIGDDDCNIAKFYTSIGRAYSHQGEYQLALKYILKSLRIRERLLPDHFGTAIVYTDIGKLYSLQKNYNQAVTYHLKALQLRQKFFPANDSNIAWSLYQIGKVYYEMNDLKTALNYYEKSLEMAKKCLTTSEFYFMPRILLDIALVYHDKPNEAIQYRLQALEAQKTNEPFDYRNLAFILDTIASTYKTMGRTQDSIKYYEEALHIREEHLSNDQYGINRNLDYLASLYEEMGDMTSALVFYGKSLKMYEQYYPYHHGLCEKTRTNINRIRRKLK